MQSMPVSICFLTVSAMAGVTLAAITTGSVISPPATRAGMSAQPLGGGKRPICEVLIRVRLRRMFPSSLVSAFDPGHDHTTDCNRTRSGADALGDGYPGGTDPIGVLTGVPAARGSGSLLTRRWRGGGFEPSVPRKSDLLDRSRLHSGEIDTGPPSEVERSKNPG